MAKLVDRMQYEWALSRIEQLTEIVTEEMPENNPLKIEFRILTDLVTEYSDANFDLGKPTLQECLKERMFAMGLSQSALADMIGTTQSRISDILCGKTTPSFNTAKQICLNLNIPASIILGV